MEYFYFTLSAKWKLKEISTPLTIACGGECCVGAYWGDNGAYAEDRKYPFTHKLHVVAAV